jgi:hypothetical protein
VFDSSLKFRPIYLDLPVQDRSMAARTRRSDGGAVHRADTDVFTMERDEVRNRKRKDRHSTNIKFIPICIDPVLMGRGMMVSSFEVMPRHLA